MPRLMTIAAISACYFVFAILLNSVGTVILQSINSFGISKPDASTLEGFKDLSIAIVSFFVASYIPRIGYKLALISALMLVTAVCLLTPMLAEFWAIKLLFACIGSAFAFVKVTVYTVVGQLSDDARSHSALLNTIEGIFMLGMLSGYWVFSAFIDPAQPESQDWLQVYYLLSAITLAAAVTVYFSPVKNEKAKAKGALASEFIGMLQLTYKPLVLIFVISIFLYVLIEQGIGTWLPTFNREIMQLPVNVAVQLTSIFAGALAVGRLLAGQILRYVNWFLFLNICLAFMAALILVTLPMSNTPAEPGITTVLQAPLAAYLLPLIGLFMAPIYPIINSVMLSSVEKGKQAAMTGLIVVFSALGGTTGSVITGLVFEYMGGQQAFYMSLVPMLGIAISIAIFKKLSKQ